MASILRTVVVATLLAAWSFPAGAATNEGSARKSRAQVTEVASGAGASRPATDQAQGYAEREQQKPDLQNFQGGEGYIYIGGGVLTVVLLVLLILILV